MLKRVTRKHCAISVSMELSLLERAEEAAVKAGLSRSELIRRCVAETLDRAEAAHPEPMLEAAV